jgi:TRAP-type mannitol/chloroaromatic compound transport system substrate-binding protein
MYHGADYYWVGQHPAYAFFTCVPMGMTAQELSNWYYHGGGMALHDELNQIFGLKGFLGGNTGAQSGGWFRKEITSAADFQGLKFRMPGLGGVALGKLGASVQNLPGAEVYQALSSGAIDGTEWIGPWADEKAGFQEITKFYYTAGFHEPGAGLTLAMNRGVYDSLTPAQQRIFEIVAGEGHQWNLAQFLSNNSAALARLQAAGVKTLEFPNDVWDAFARAAQEVHDDNMGDEIYKKVYDSYVASMKSSSTWLKLSDGAYVAQRDRTQG